MTKGGQALRALDALVKDSTHETAAWRKQVLSVGRACIASAADCNSLLAKAGIILHKDAPGASGASSGLRTATTEGDADTSAEHAMSEWMHGLHNGSIPPHRWGEVQRKANALLPKHYPRVHVER